uniref:NADH-ubiquinone oxidoreductase chain 4 n=1 Tax=Osedax rubiplumus TaxID=283784 RepID=A0A6M4AII9_OSERU|nr:NADH dehydrogenase subunit 4 [Osedax rubiplumus]QJQ26881.1 NADH dehydrogenase subunit 4 [Osedax rubiplumus]
MLMLIMPMIVPLLLPSFWMSSMFTFLFLSFMFTIKSMPMTMWSVSINSFMFIDSMSGPLLLLILWITSMTLFASSKVYSFNLSPKLFVLTIVTLAAILLLSFTCNNVLSFYFMFESSLFPTLFLILLWGYQPERLTASFYFILYTLTASLPLLAMIAILYFFNDSLSMNLSLWASPFISSFKFWWILSILAFLVKLPMFMFHLWLPKAHVEAPVAGSMFLAAVLLKLGTYGLLRLSFLFPAINFSFFNTLYPVAIWGALITSMICIRQTDMKSLIAYSSVGHMGILLASIMSSSCIGWQASLLMMIAHGISSSFLFSLANSSYEIFHSRNLFLNKGMITIFPFLPMWWFVATLSNMAAPPSINLVSEISMFISILSISSSAIILLPILSFLGAAYSLILYSSTQHGPLSTSTTPPTLPNSSFNLMFLLHSIPVLMLSMHPSFIMTWI